MVSVLEWLLNIALNIFIGPMSRLYLKLGIEYILGVITRCCESLFEHSSFLCFEPAGIPVTCPCLAVMIFDTL